jgi:hypothetical protein
MLTTTQGASSTDFRRFVHKYYLANNTSNSDNGTNRSLPQGGLGPTFYVKLWQWVTTHPDIRIIHNSQVSFYSLTEFENAEISDAGGPGVVISTNNHISPTTPSAPRAQPAESLLALRATLRQRLSAEGRVVKDGICLPLPTAPSALSSVENAVDEGAVAISEIAAARQPRRTPDNNCLNGAVFDEPTSTTSAPRLYASQNRIWQALTGHSIDLKKVPTMEFALLSLIAASGTGGITQPDLGRRSGQDKRSVPHRTDELARKGYIVKNPVQAGKVRTSLCVHTKFISQNHFTSSGAVEDVFQVGTFVASGFMQLLYDKFKDAGVVPTREIRKRLVNAHHQL